MNILILAAGVLLAWDANTEPDLAGYKLHIGIRPISLEAPVQILDVGNVTLYEVGGLDYGTQYFFAATALNKTGQESGYSNEVTYTPMPPVADKIRYWSRFNCSGRMNGARFEAGQSKDGPWTLLGYRKWWPSMGETMTLPPGTLAPYKAFRYVAAQQGVAPGWGTVAEIEFIQNGTKITGVVFGTPGAWSYPKWIPGTNTVEKAFDGNTETYWDAPGWSPDNHAGIERP